MLRLALVSIAFFLAGCYPELDWREFTSPEGQFSVLFPRKPVQAAREFALGGHPIRMEMYSAQVAEMAFGVGYADLPKGVDYDRILKAGRDALVRNIAGAVTNERAIALDGASGIEFAAMGTTRDAPLQLAARVLIAGTRYYQIAFIGHEGKASAADTELFLGSFKLLARGRSLAPERRREDDEQGEELQSAEQHDHGANPGLKIVQQSKRRGRTHLVEARPHVVDAADHRGEGADEIEARRGQ